MAPLCVACRRTSGPVLTRNGSSHSSPFLTSIPGYLRRWPWSLPVRRRRRKRGRRGGFAVKLKHFLAQQKQESRRSFLGFHVKGLVGDFSIRWRSLDPVYQWNKNTSMTMAEAAPLPAYGSPRFYRAGVCVSRYVQSEEDCNPSQPALDHRSEIQDLKKQLADLQSQLTRITQKDSLLIPV
ncbi:unnamed protein product [Leuciscus chuanchicus]